MNPLVLLLFFVSGATALVYEVIWSKYLALMFGSTIQAQTVVLAVFMGGLALGNRLFGKRSAQMKQPLATYGYIELVIGLYAFFFHTIYSAADKTFVSVGSNFADAPTTLLLIKGVVAVSLLIVPTVLMGGTLPLLASWLERQIADAGRGSARFYSTNSLGAVFGSGVAGFYLVQHWGMTASLQWSAFGNFAVALFAVAISRREGDLAPVSEKAVSSEAVLPARAAYILVAITGGVSMGLEVICSRTVALLVGGSLQAFAIVLMAFILGIGFGAGLVASPRFAKYQNQRTIFGLMLAAAALIAIFIFGIEEWAIAYTAARYALAPNPAGYLLHQFMIGIVSILALGVPAGLLGAVLPMAIRAGSPTGGSLGDQVGKLLTWNTIGAVVGVLVTGFILMPNLGLRSSFLTLALVLAVIGAFGARKINANAYSRIGYVVLASVLLLFGIGEGSWKSVVGAGLFRLRNTRLTHDDIASREKDVKVLYYKDAPDATVAVEDSHDRQQRLLRINGKTDASTRGDLPTQYLVGHLPIFARPQSKDVFLLGFGSGITAAAVLGHPIESLTLAENCGPVLEAAPLFEEWNRGALKDPRVRLRREDARTVLKLSDRKYDVIINEPSNPWVVGVGSVFSREFYELCASRLKDGGINAQWFHIYEMHDGIVELVIRTFTSVYPYVEIWEPTNGDLVLLGSMKPWNSTPALFEEAFKRERVRRDLEEIGLRSPVNVFARLLASHQTAHVMLDDGPRQSDEFPILEYAAPEAFFIGQRATRIFSYDERTRQMAFAPEWRRKLLRNIPSATLNEIFGEYSTGNPDLYKYLTWRGSHREEGQEHAVYDLDVAMPMIFRTPQSYNFGARDLSNVEQTLTKAETDILTESPDAGNAIALIEKTLETEAKLAQARRGWSPAHFAVVGARTALTHGEMDRAARLINLGKQFDAQNVEISFLERVWNLHHQIDQVVSSR